ncbi:cardiolipin synthase [Pricia antarctica]|uniref:Cardiolipin synthase n=1 Tax=Pricia antarctica TaxID=641691 RepID=A0A1G7D1H9_9FLAO|nr:cardiolipin synthase [Pricia antarctica]SDE44880.1 cardiolipin synthase [Pricia antarctica]
MIDIIFITKQTAYFSHRFIKLRQMLYTIFFIIYVVIALAIVISLLVNGVRPSKTLAWLLAIFTIPVGGILLYLMVGRNRRKKRWERLSKEIVRTDGGTVIPETPKINEKHKKLIRLIQQNSGFNPSENNEVVYLKDGKTTFKTIFSTLETATDYIHLQYYIFEEGELADKLLELFRTKMLQGVKIRLIYDGIGSFSLSRPYLKKLKQIGVEVFPFLPFSFGRFLVSLNYRNHRKIIVVDGVTAFTGGINVSDKYLKDDTILGKWHDMHLKIQGPAVDELNQVFLVDWQLVSGQEIRPSRKTASFVGGESTVQIVSSGPDDDFPAIEQVYFSIINSAERYLYITNPYIIPGQSILTALETAALSGVDVRLLISEKNDSRLVNWSVRSYFEPLLRAGIKVYLFPDGFLHSKIMLSDDAIASVGTANIDVRSFEQNYEVNAIIYDPKVVTALKEDFLQDSQGSRQLTYQEHQKRSWPDKLKEGFAKVFSPIL